MFPPAPFEGRRDYHAITRGFILNEIFRDERVNQIRHIFLQEKRETHATYDNDFRRAHPSGLTIGEYLRKELADKVGGADVFVGLPDSGKQPALVI